MNCPNCKNPIQDNSTECEWCGSLLGAENIIVGSDHQLTINFFLPKPKPIYGKEDTCMVFIDEKMIHEFLLNDGCDFNCYLKKNPVIKLSFNKGRKLYELPDFKFEINKKYRIDWRPNWLGIIRFDKPAIFMIE